MTVPEMNLLEGVKLVANTKNTAYDMFLHFAIYLQRDSLKHFNWHREN